MRYFSNIKAWATGWSRFGELTFKAGWSATYLLWWLLYLFDYGSHVMAGGAVVSWSRWFYDNRETNKVAKFFDRLLNHFEEGHGRSAGPPLWGTKDCEMKYRLLVVATLVAIWFLTKS